MYKTFLKKHVGTPTWEDFSSTSVGCDLGGSKCESPHHTAWFPAIPCSRATYLIWSIKPLSRNMLAHQPDFDSSVGCDLGGSKCESPPPNRLVSCHPVHVGNMPNLIYQTLIKKHVGTPIWEDSITVSCDSGGSKCESPHLSAWFPAIPCTPATYLIWSIILTKKHVGAPIWEDLNSTRVDCDLGGSKCESPHLSAWFCMVLHGSLSSRAHRQHLIWSIKPLSKCRLWFKSFLSAKVPTYLHGSAWFCKLVHGSAWFPAIPLA